MPTAVELMLASQGVAASAPRVEQAQDPSKFTLTWTTSDETPFWPGFYFATLGAPGKGKTHLALTLSKKYPGVWPPPEPLLIEDVAIVNTDSNGQAAFKEAKVTVKHVIDLSIASKDDIFKAQKTLPKMLAARIEQYPEIKAVVFDHASGFFESVCYCIQSKSKDGPKIYKDLAKEGKDFLTEMREKLRVPVVYNFHIKRPPGHFEAMGSTGAVGEASHKAAALAAGMDRDDGDYGMPGREIADVFRNTMTLSAWLNTSDLPNGKEDRTLSFTKGGVFTKRRLTLCVDKEEPAHLGALFDKIALQVGQEWR